MNSPLLHAIMAFVMLTLSAVMIVAFLAVRRAGTLRPDDPRVQRAVRLIWLYPLGAIFSLVAGIMNLMSWLGTP